MVFRSARRRQRTEPAGIRPRVSQTSLERADFTEFAPEPLAFLGQAACIQLEFFELLAKAVATSPGLAPKEGVSVVAGVALRRHHRLLDEVRAHDGDPVGIMQPFADATLEFREQIQGADWWELLLGIHIASGMLDDYFSHLAQALPRELRERVTELLAPDPRAAGVLEAEIERGIREVPGLGDRLALWGRSIVGDTLLVARSALRGSESGAGPGSGVEPVFTELIAEHTRRMDALGLTA
ncbi:ferritin-like fold-containing protein [Agromyces archimandritae]|uniref:Ferritin-like domain-containing protein n=1 Tax=Agromyces archimandritae TaxID=2781962 RepID=A0A975FKN2_9MICO|nr:ferritin-like fold-containing protein [Agromyces archimandritae]QTX04275.1 hypothetical protein G127AT_13465 [Agromyces archimandritae]